jgi:hypothetical protein
MRLSVQGYGRVGSYATAKRNRRCRARQYWAIARWDDTPVRPLDPISPVTGWVEVAEHGHYRTKTEAQAVLARIQANQEVR